MLESVSTDNVIIDQLNMLYFHRFNCKDIGFHIIPAIVYFQKFTLNAS